MRHERKEEDHVLWTCASLKKFCVVFDFEIGGSRRSILIISDVGL